MGEVLAFRTKRLSGFIPENGQPFDGTIELYMVDGTTFSRPLIAGRIVDDRSPSETNPDSGDCS